MIVDVAKQELRLSTKMKHVTRPIKVKSKESTNTRCKYYGCSKLSWPRFFSFLIIKESRIIGAGEGLFSTERFKRGDIITGFHYPHMLDENDTKEIHRRLSSYYQTNQWDSSPLPSCGYKPPGFDYMFWTVRGKVWIDLSLDNKTPTWYKLNHSKNPNVKATMTIRGPVFTPLRKIGKDEELTIYYEDTNFIN